MAAGQSVSAIKRKRPILSDDSSDEPEDLPTAKKQTTSPLEVEALIRPPSHAWERSTAFGLQRFQGGSVGSNGFGFATDPSKRPRLGSNTSLPSRDQDSAESEGFGSSGNGSMSTVPRVHHMFDTTGRVPPPPQPTHSDDDDQSEEDEEDVRMQGVNPPGSFTVFASDSPLLNRVGNEESNSHGIEIVPSPPLAAVRAPPPSPANTNFNAQEGQKMSIFNLMSPPEATILNPPQYIPDNDPSATMASRLESVTLLIEDKRAENQDMEMVEVTIQVTPGPPGTDYVTADCEELVDRLQEGPSRVDGLAKIYCLRTVAGTDKVLRQCILRLEPQGPTTGKGAVRVPKSLELRIMLEKLQLKHNRPFEGMPQPRADGRVPIPPTPHGRREPRLSLVPGLEEIKAGTVRYQHPHAYWPQPRNPDPYYAEVAATRKATPLPVANETVDKAARTKKAMADYIRPLIQADPFWPTFHEAKGHVKSNQEAVKCLQFFQDLVDKYINSHHTIPEQVIYAGGKRLTKAALLEAVGRGTTWSSDCHIVLELIKRFGPGGPDQKAEVVELLQSTSTKGGLTEFVAKMKRIKAEHDREKNPK